MRGNEILKEFIWFDEDIGLYLLEDRREAGRIRLIFCLSVRRHGYFGYFECTIIFERVFGLLIEDDDFALNFIQFISLICHEQLITMDDMAFPRDFIGLEDGPSQAASDIIDIVLTVEVTSLHGTVHANGRIRIVLILLLYQIGFEEEVASFHLIVPPFR